MPDVEKACNNESPCAESTYDVSVFDSRQLVSGTSRVDHYAPGELHFYTFQKLNAGTQGLCVVATPADALSSSCTVQAERVVESCFNSLQGCVSSANAAAQRAYFAAGATPPAYTPMRLWNAYDGPFTTSNGTCACFAKAATCIAKSVCSGDVVASQQQLSQVCGFSDVCSSTGACAIPPTPASSLVNRGAGAAASAFIDVYVSKFNTGSLGSNSFTPPTSAALANWASAGFGSGEQRLVVWSSDGYDAAASTVLIGVKSEASDVDIAVTVTALSAFPVSYSGSLASAAGVTAANIRAGGLQLVVSLSCDAFVDPEPA